MKLGCERTAADRAKRREKFMPDGVPKHVRCYDDGGESIDRYTVIFTKANCFMGERGRVPYLAMSGAPFHPQGFCLHCESREPLDIPTYGHLGKKIKFADLPAACRKVVIRDYEDYWGISDRPPEEW